MKRFKPKVNNPIIIKIFVFLFFMVVSFLILRNVFLMNGLILGGDWSLPIGHSQIDKFYENYSGTWSTANSFLGGKTLATNVVPFLAIVKAFSLLGLGGQIYPKLILLFIFAFAGFFMYSLLRSLKLKNPPAIIGGVIYMTTPLFFNYTIMGWFYVLLFAVVLLPLVVKYFIKAVEENSIKYTVITGVIYAIAFIQAQTVLWFMMVFLLLGIYLIKDKKSFFVYLRALVVMVIILIFFSSYWLLGSLIVLDKGIAGSDIVKSGVSLGMTLYFLPVNIIRLFSSVYNSQYESIINLSPFSFLSFVLPILVFGSLFLKQNKKLILSFWLIALIPVAMYLLNFSRDILLRIPFSNVIRDFPRFTILSSFAYAVLASFFLSFLFNNKKRILKYLGFVLIIIWFLSIFPWWKSSLTDWRASSGPDIRIRLKNFSNEYLWMQEDFSKKKLDQKAVYLPFSGIVGFEDDIQFKGDYHETADISAGFSPISGALSLTDRSLGVTKEYVDIIKEELKDNLVDVLSLTNVKYFVIRKNMTMAVGDKEKIIKSFEYKLNESKISDYYSGDKVLIYSRNNFLPHFYTPKSIIVSSDVARDLRDAVLQKDYQVRSAIYSDQNKDNPILNDLIKEQSIELTQKEKINKIEEEIKSLEKDLVYPEDSYETYWQEWVAEDKLNQLKLDLAKEQDNLQGLIDTRVAKLPVLEFKKVNPTKYRIMVHQAQGEFPLVFNESFHNEWKIYLGDKEKININKNQLNNYKILDGNSEDQANKEEITNYMDNDWISILGNSFISKNFQDTIQNDNLPSDNFYETWFKAPIDNNSNHLIANSYANSWTIDTDKICQANIDKCVKNPDGSYDFEIIVEFWPQRLFYIGATISIATLFGCIIIAVFVDRKRKKKIKVQKIKK
jgi:hypothetical protein